MMARTSDRGALRTCSIQGLAARLTLVLATLLTGCAGETAACTADNECASGHCRDDGTCAAISLDGAGTEVRFNGNDIYIGSDTAESDAATPGGTDATTASDGAKLDGKTGSDSTGSDATATETSGGACVPDHNGVVARSEVTLLPGLAAKWQAAADVKFATKGQLEPDGSRTWDLVTLPGDKAVPIETLALDKLWFAKEFPGATYAVRLTAGSDLLGIFEATDTALLLRGVATPESGLMATRLSYDPPVPVLQFPLAEGNTWTVKAIASGQLQGNPLWVQSDTYSFAVDAHGKLTTSLGTFPVLRVRVALDRLIGLMPVYQRSVVFVSECYGTVANIDAPLGTQSDDFENAAEVRRIAP